MVQRTILEIGGDIHYHHKRLRLELYAKLGTGNCGLFIGDNPICKIYLSLIHLYCSFSKMCIFYYIQLFRIYRISQENIL